MISLISEYLVLPLTLAGKGQNSGTPDGFNESRRRCERMPASKASPNCKFTKDARIDEAIIEKKRE